jgi:hypothetical protein
MFKPQFVSCKSLNVIGSCITFNSDPYVFFIIDEYPVAILHHLGRESENGTFYSLGELAAVVYIIGVGCSADVLVNAVLFVKRSFLVFTDTTGSSSPFWHDWNVKVVSPISTATK